MKPFDEIKKIKKGEEKNKNSVPNVEKNSFECWLLGTDNNNKHNMICTVSTNGK